MTYLIKAPAQIKGSIKLPASKSISNRLLIIKALSSNNIDISNLSEAQDTKTLEALLASTEETLDCGHAGTAMRFLTAYLSTLNRTAVLTGSDRMLQRPIGVLAESLKQMGVDITYLGETGYPPLQIKGGGIEKAEVTIDSTVSSQFISALMLIGPTLPNGLTIHLTENVVSQAYLEMTLKTIKHFGIKAKRLPNLIVIEPGEYKEGALTVEADWSAASYWYSMVAMSEDAEIELLGLGKDSWQGDSIISELFTLLGVKTKYTENGVVLKKYSVYAKELGYDFINCPDLVQTMCVTTSALGIPTRYSGLETLKIKETDRVDALKSELQKVGVDIEELKVGEITSFPPELSDDGKTIISTFEDHRMAMAFTPLACMFGQISIANPEVVQKSYPNFWDDLKSVGFTIEEIG
ncbi:MAG: 3-phosphoshikimate 1-carboxyvinyltransferase [Flavobacteriales bacterium]|nr:3-phosphoshikimate 1-carboxyvinyltransferase [Flavobacteriales bacterium]